MPNKNTLFIVLIAVIVILAVVVLYALVVKPGFEKHNIEKQTEGYQIAILDMMKQAATCETIPLTFENQTITLVAVECLEQAQQESEII